MNKKLLWIPVGVVLLIFIIKGIVTPESRYGSNFTAEVPVLEKGKSSSMKKLELYIDFSKSMRGFIDFSQLPNSYDASGTMKSTITKFLDNVEAEYGIVTKSICGNKTYDKNQFRKALDNKTIFNSDVTLLQQFIEDKVEYVNDSSVIAIVSDMVLSYGKDKLLRVEKDTFYNHNQLDALVSTIHSAMKKVKTKGCDVILLQYLSDFNGKYYCNYTENIKGGNAYKNMLMKDRPYYMLLIGMKEDLKNLLANECLIKADNVYASFGLDNDFVETSFDIEEKKENNWTKGDDSDGGTGVFWTTTDLGDYKTVFSISCDSFLIPSYLNANKLHAIGNQYVSNVMFTDGDYDAKSRTLKFNVQLQSFEKLNRESDIVIDLFCDNSWVKECNLSDDVNQPLDTLKKRTWEIEKLVNAIDEAFRGRNASSKERVATFSFGIKIK